MKIFICFCTKNDILQISGKHHMAWKRQLTYAEIERQFYRKGAFFSRLATSYQTNISLWRLLSTRCILWPEACFFTHRLSTVTNEKTFQLTQKMLIRAIKFAKWKTTFMAVNVTTKVSLCVFIRESDKQSIRTERNKNRFRFSVSRNMPRATSYCYLFNRCHIQWFLLSTFPWWELSVIWSVFFHKKFQVNRKKR